MSNEQLTREYKMSDSELTAFTQHVCDSMTRDATEFSAYSILEANVTDLQAKCDAFEVFPTDDFVNQELLSAIEARDNILTELRVMVKAMAMRVELKWGKKSPKYEKLGISDMSQITVETFTARARMALGFMTKYLPELSSGGLTQTLLDNMEAKAQQLDDAVRTVLDLASYRMEKTSERITKGNELYKLMSKYCEVGKRTWDKINPAFFHDYVIYDYSGGGSSGGSGGTVPAAPLNLSVDVNTMIFSWTNVPNTQNFVLEKSAVGIEWEIIYTGPDNFFMYIPETEGLNVYRVKGSNSIGSGNYSLLMSYNYVVPIQAPGYLALTVTNAITGEISLNWEEIAEATRYLVFTCQVATGAPAPPLIDYSLAGEFTVATFSATFGTGSKRFFYVQAGTTDKLSVPSDAVFVEL